MLRTRALIALAVAAGLLTACGGAEPAQHAPGSIGNPMVGAKTTKTASGRSNEAAGVTRAQERTAANTPCSLVSRAQASAIVGERVRKPSEAAQGPTCVYRGEKSFVSVAIQTLDFDRLKGELGRPQRAKVAGEVAYCGNYGQQMLYVPLAGGNVLTVAAPCAQAKRFAEFALDRLSP